MIELYALLCVAALAVVVISKDRRLMNAATVVDAAGCLALAVYGLAAVPMPVYYLADRLFALTNLGLYMVASASAVFLLAAVYSDGYVPDLLNMGAMKRENLRLFYVSFNLLLLSVILAFLSNSLALFWVFTELTTLFSCVLIISVRDRGVIHAALNYVFIASAAMIFSFMGILMVYALTQRGGGVVALNWDSLAAGASSFNPSLLGLAAVFMFIGFAAKAAVAPFHTGLAPVYGRGPVIFSILSGSLLTIGVYGLIRVNSVVAATAAAPTFSMILICFGVFTIAVAGFTMLAQRRLRRLFAFSSVENMGVALIAVGVGTPVALLWVLYHVAAHALAKALIFFSHGILRVQYRSVDDEKVVNLIRLQPLAFAGLIVGSAAVIGAPLLPIFMSKFFILSELARLSPILLGLTILLLAVVAIAVGYSLMRVVTRVEGGGPEAVAIPSSMRAPIVALILILFVLGLAMPEGLRAVLAGALAELGV
ncbi:MAG: proton-conducting transporter membrane subunit [Candidatus Bathyarchaeota archaeon]|nr:proton-conducting transporter membrane subunit [Candidatus Bathyarchaeota archaeon]